ncbi:Uncharacterized protein APZ42_012545, partial [Daphnia magna]
GLLDEKREKWRVGGGVRDGQKKEGEGVGLQSQFATKNVLTSFLTITAISTVPMRLDDLMTIQLVVTWTRGIF